jgi:hypothetical protein
MDSYRADHFRSARSGQDELPGDALSRMSRRRLAHVGPVDRSLRCVSSGYLSGGCSCRSSIPRDVVTAAWGAELECGGADGDRFFNFAWRGGVWLAYGLPDGKVRGVYCPAHRAEREQRLGYDPRLAPAAAEHSH